MIALRIGIVLATAAAGWAAAWAADQPIPGRRLAVRIGVTTERTSFAARDPGIVAPEPNGADDPRTAGARLDIVNPGTGEAASFDLLRPDGRSTGLAPSSGS
jgi:hypothetical protein